MMHGINNSYLYSAKKITAKWTDGNLIVELRGTGFFVLKNDILYLITNRHVVQPGYSDSRYANFRVTELVIEHFERNDNNGKPTCIKTNTITNWREFKYHSNSNNDVACLKNPIAMEEMTINSWIDYSMLASKDWFDEKLTVCDTIAYPGFPEWYDHQNNTPVFRMGTIASDPRLNYSHIPNAPIADRIAYEGFSTSGASGSPVFSIQRGFQTGSGIEASKGFYREVKLIGINAGHFEDQVGHSGISYMFKSSTILDLINSSVNVLNIDQ